MASIRKISLLPRLDVAGTSVLSGMFALATKGLLEGMPVRGAFVRLKFRTPSPNLLARYSQNESSSATLLFF